MEVQENLLEMFYMSRALGLAPFVLKRDGKGRIESFKLNYWLCGYSVLFLLVAGKTHETFVFIQCHRLFVFSVSLTFRFIVVDSSARNPVR